MVMKRFVDLWMLWYSQSCSNLRLLNLNYCTSITRLPDSMGQSLQELRLVNCKKLEMLPPSIQHLKGLTFLDLRGCTSLKALPDSVGALPNLKDLSAYNCTSLQALPTSIGHLSSLETLYIGANPGCQISSEDIGSGSAWTRLWQLQLENCCGLGSRLDYDAMKSLTILSLKDSALTELPESMGKLIRLRFLTIQCERLQCLPNAIGDLKMLVFLTLTQCLNLTRLPKSLGAISSLEHIAIRNCPVRKLPKSLGSLSKLRRFWIRDCKNLQKLPSSIRFLRSLQDFEFVNCGSREAKGASSTGLQDLLECGALGTLKIQDSTFTEVVESLGQSVPLDQLAVGCERLQWLPNSFGYLKRLLILELARCLHLTRLPKNLGAITSLERLTIRCCPIRKLPRSISLLSQLLELKIIGCKNLEKLPTSVRKLLSLLMFKLKDCGSIEAMGALTTLQGLPIWGSTSITKLPASLGIVSTLIVYSNSSFFYGYRSSSYDTLQVLEEDDSGFLKACQHKVSGKLALLRGVH
ncbi:hypothetical protein KC19_3G103100 [Ceratodon purpureus]|uniref:Disease resistance R13L4/SHOC-2-like LRR domain-containing protein n=1 Tax=Ceratodon purpureus TaxID=3225 RepID=A0A8T0IKF3_CERPU|nr:hypothetical protein KC19_3G103100 [Ceratodon purpureus]